MNLRTLRLAIVALCLSSPVALAQPPAEPTANELNSQGFDLYRAGKYAEALQLFEQAWRKDENHALAHYNYAATLGVMRKKKQVCEFNAFRSTILEHLTKAVTLDPRRGQRMKKDADFDTVRDTVGYQRLLGRDPSKPGDLSKVLEAVTWYGPLQGVFGPMVGIDFQRNGKLELWSRTPTESGNPPVTTSKVRGHWKIVDGGKVKVMLRKPYRDVTELNGTFTPEGKLDFGEPVGALSDDPGECDA